MFKKLIDTIVKVTKQKPQYIKCFQCNKAFWLLNSRKKPIVKTIIHKKIFDLIH